MMKQIREEYDVGDDTTRSARAGSGRGHFRYAASSVALATNTAPFSLLINSDRILDLHIPIVRELGYRFYVTSSFHSVKDGQAAQNGNNQTAGQQIGSMIGALLGGNCRVDRFTILPDEP
jgi:hypothetical protein